MVSTKNNQIVKRSNALWDILFFHEDKDVVMELDEQIWRRTQIYMYTTAVLVAVWGIFDVFIDFGNLWMFLALRAIYTPLALVFAYHFRHEIFRENHKKWALVHYLLLIIDIGIMVLWTDNFVKYLIGFSTIFWGASVIMLWRFWNTVIPGIIVIVIATIRFYYFPNNVAPGEFVTGLYYFATCLTFTSIISAYGYWNAYQLTENSLALKFAQEKLMQAEKMASLNTVVASVAHDINTPVGTAITAVSHAEEKFKTILLLLDHDEVAVNELSDPVKDGIESTGSALSELLRTAGLVERLKSTAIDQSSYERREFNLRQYIEENIVNIGLKPRLKKANIAIEVKGDNIIVDSIPGEISQIFTNLIMNSIHHGFKLATAGNSGNKIQIEVVESENQSVNVYYTDNGVGMSREVEAKIFEPFFTTRGSSLSSGDRGHRGTGLGMSIVYNCVTKHLGGTISVSSGPDRGATFIIELPRLSRT